MKIIDRLLGSRADSNEKNDAVVSSLVELRSVNEDIRDELRSGGRNQHRANVLMILIGLVTLVVTVVGVIVTRQVRDEVQGLAELTPQEVIDELRVGMSIEDLTFFLEADPVVNEIIEDHVQLQEESSLRRVLYRLPEKHIWVMAVADTFGNIRFFGITVDDQALDLRFPSTSSGDYADFFRTGETTLGEIVEACQTTIGGDGGGASHSYLALGCTGAGANGYAFNIVALNFYGPGASQHGLCCSLVEQVTSGVLDDDVAGITFNSFAWGDYQFLPMDDFTGDVLGALQIGPWLGEFNGDEPRTPPGEATVIPGAPLSRWGIGPVQAGMTLREAEERADIVLGHAPATSDEGCAVIEVPHLGIWFEVSLPGEPGEDVMEGVIQSVHGSTHTDEGVVIGASLDEVERTYGRPTRSFPDPDVEGGEIAVYEEGGYAYMVTFADDQVTELASGAPDAMSSLEGCT